MSKSILKATTLIGGSQIVNMIIGLVRSKAVAIILGPAGTGFIGALGSATGLTQRLASLGIANSAVRDIAQAYASNDQERIQLTVSAQRMAVIVTGVFGMLLTLVLARQLSLFTFSTDTYTNEIRLIAVAVFFNIIQEGQTSVIQGTRQIRKLAELSIIGAALSTFVSIPFIYVMGLDGVAPYIVVVAFSQYLVTFYYARQLNIRGVWLGLRAFWYKVRGMVRLGLAFMLGGLASAFATYLIRAYLVRSFDLSGAGLYQAAFGISGVYINVVLQAMGKDFYPRLTAVAYQSDKEAALINEQTEIGVILAAPGLLVTLALAPWIIRLLYSAEYLVAYPILQWMVFGIFLKTVSWPLGYFYVSRGKSQVFFITELVFNILHVAFVILLSSYFGLMGTGVAMLVLYLLYASMMYFLVHKSIGFGWENHLWRKMGALGAIFTISMLLSILEGSWITTLIVLGFALGTGLFALKTVLRIIEVDSWQALWRKLRRK